MTVKRPTADQLRAIAADLGMSMSDVDLASYLGIMQANFAAYDVVRRDARLSTNGEVSACARLQACRTRLNYLAVLSLR